MSQNQDYYNKTGLYSFIIAILLSFGIMGYLVFLHPKIQIDKVKEMAQSDSTLAGNESGAAQAEKFDPSTVQNPWVSSDELVSYGKSVFSINCVACHGKEGKGDGPASAGLVPPPRNLVAGKWKQGGKSKDLFETISKGINGTSMAAFGHLSVVDRWAIVHFIRSITQDKPEDNKSELESFATSAK